jgi:putative membrane protein
MYEWIKALHVIAVIAWMAGMLYLPRLFVYHCETEAGSKQSETFKVMERRLLKAIINPAMTVTWLAGLYLAWAGHWFSAPWLHEASAGRRAVGRPRFLFQLGEGFRCRPEYQSQDYRVIGEVSTILMIGIVILVVVKPF